MADTTRERIAWFRAKMGKDPRPVYTDVEPDWVRLMMALPDDHPVLDMRELAEHRPETRRTRR